MENQNFLSEYFGVITKSRTYLNLLYLLMAFPLGLTYFIFLVVGISVGVSLIIVWVGLFILAILFPIIWLLIRFERAQTIYMVGVPLEPIYREIAPETSIWQRIKGFLVNPVTWKGILYLFFKFPYGIVAFSLVTAGLSISLGFLAAPFIYPFATYDLGLFVVNSLSDALGVAVVGALILPGILHIFNYYALLAGKVSEYLLANKGQVKPDPSPVEKETAQAV